MKQHNEIFALPCTRRKYTT